MTQNFWVRRNFWEVPRRVMKVSSEFQILKLKRITWLVDNRREAFLFMNVCLSCILSRLMNALSLAPSWRRRELWICMWDLHVCLVSSILRRILKIRIQIRILNPWIKTFDIYWVNHWVNHLICLSELHGVCWTTKCVHFVHRRSATFTRRSHECGTRGSNV